MNNGKLDKYPYEVGKLFVSKYDVWVSVLTSEPKSKAIRFLAANDPFVVLNIVCYPESRTGIIVKLKILTSGGEICELVAYSITIKQVPAS